MAISIHIEDVTKEQPEALWDTGQFLLDMAVKSGYDDSATRRDRIAKIVQETASFLTPPVTSGDETIRDYASGAHANDATPAPDLTAVFGAGVHRPTANLAAPGTDQTVVVEMVSMTHVPPVPPAIEPPAAIEPVPSPAAAPIATTELDARGFPWDARIHGRTKAKIGDGTWRYRRGSTDEEIAVVEAELRQTMGAGVPVVPAPAAPAPVAPAAPAPVAPAAPEDFGAFMQFVISNVAAGKIQQPQVIAIVNEFDLPHVGAVFQRQDLIPQIRAKIEALLEGGA